MSVTVFCCVCGTQFPPASPAVGYRSLDKRWWCADEIACIMRASIAEQNAKDWIDDTKAMQAGLDAAWASLEADGWRI